MNLEEINHALFFIASKNLKEISQITQEKKDFLSCDAYFLNSIYNHRLSPLLFDITLDDRGRAKFSDFFLKKIKKEANLLQIKNLNIISELFQISNLFNNKNINYCFLKGPSLSLEFYDDIKLRPLRDLDILVKKDQIKECLILLENMGYRTLKNKSKLSGLIESKDIIDFHQLPPIYGPNEVIVEIHSRATSPENFKECPMTKNIFKRKKKFQNGKFRTYFPSKEDNLVHLSVHACLQHSLNNGLLTITDLMFLNKDVEMDWNYINDTYGESKISKSIFVLLEILKKKNLIQVNQLRRKISENDLFLKDIVSITTNQILLSKNQHDILKGAKLKILGSYSYSSLFSFLEQSYSSHKKNFFRLKRLNNENSFNRLFFYIYLCDEFFKNIIKLLKNIFNKTLKVHGKEKIKLQDWLNLENE